MTETKAKESEVQELEQPTNFPAIGWSGEGRVGVVSGKWKGKKKRNRRGKEKRSRELRTIECAENRLSKSGHTLAKALAKGLGTYRKKRKKSARKKKDGALRDYFDNVADGVKDVQKKASPATKDFLRAFSRKRTKNQVRNAARSISKLFPFFR